MSIILKVILLPLFALLILPTTAQDLASMKFGKVTAADFTVKSPVMDSSTNAVVLSDIGASQIEGNNKGWFSLIYKRTTRIKVLNKKGFDAGNISIGLYNNGELEEKLTNCKAITYNLENGVVQQTPLSSSDIYKEKSSKNWSYRKFTFPNLKEGSILEYTYEINSDFLFNLQPWVFQSGYPHLLSQYTVEIPEFFVYVFLSQGYVPLKNFKKEIFKNYSVTQENGTQATERYTLSGYETRSSWVAKDVPAHKEEPFTSSHSNYLAKIEFQLSRMKFPNVPVKDIMGNWEKASETLLGREDFGLAITKSNQWLADDVTEITKNTLDGLAAAQALYAYVRDHFTVSKAGGFYISDNTNLKQVFNRRNGNVAEINLLLIAMLRQVGLKADPVLISTRSNGFAHPLYPLISKYNYVLCKLDYNNQTYFLDATQPRMGFGKLSTECYNGNGFVVAKPSGQIQLVTDSLKEFKSTLLFIINDSAGLSQRGTYTSVPGYYASTNLREKLAKKDKDAYFKEIEKGYSYPMEFSNIQIDSFNKYDYPVSIKYDMQLKLGGKDIIYFNPMFSEATKQNPFKSAERKYPVEMPYRIREIYVLNMQIPKGFEVDELPKSTRAKLVNGEGEFEYIIHVAGKNIVLQSKIVLNKTIFEPDDYQMLRDFFALIVKKHGEQIVFKKIK